MEFIDSHPNIVAMKGSPQAVCDTIDQFCRDHHFLMNLGPHKSRVIEELIKANKPQCFVEFGGYMGYSALRLGATLRDVYYSSNIVSEGKKPVYYVLERDAFFASCINKLVGLAGLEDVVKVVIGDSASSIRWLQKETPSLVVDMVLFDHDELQYTPDLCLLERLGLVGRGSIIIADNVIIPGAPDYLEFLRQAVLDGRYVSRQVPSFLPFGIPEPLEVTTICQNSP